jgi:inhibitor of cysteine peptidase
MMPRKLILGITIVIWFFAGIYYQANCQAQGLSSTAPWPMFHHDQKHTGKTTNMGTRVGALKWRFKTDGQVVSSPAIAADGTVYVGSDDNYVYAINRDGSLKWRYKTGGIVRSSPAIAEDGTVYIGSFDGKLYAFNGSTGAPKWAEPFQTGNGIESSPVIAADGTVYVGSSDGHLYAVDTNGNLVWSTLLSGTGSPIGSSPAIGNDGTIYVGCWIRDLFAVNQSGDLLWQYPTYTGGVFSSPTIAGDGSIFIANDGAWRDELSDLPEPYNEPWYIHRIIDGSGAISILMENGQADVYSTAAVEADTSFFIGYGQDLLAYNPDGEGNWVFATDGKVDSSPVIGGDGIVYVGSDDGFFYAVDPNCACAIWLYETGGCIKSSAAIDNDSYRTIYVGSQDNYLYAFYDGFRISGKVTSNGAGLSGVTMTLTSAYLAEPVVALTDAEGKYDFPGLETPIKYTVTPSKDGYYFIPASTQVTIQDASQENVDFVGVLGFTVSGQVTLNSTGLGSVTMVLSGTTSVTTQTDSQGNYSFSDVVPGTYTVTPSKQGYGFSPSSQTVTVTDGNQTGINFTAEAGYSISGQVTLSGSGLVGVTMTLSGGVSKVTETNSEGRYSLTGLQNGSYVVTPTKEGYQFSPASQSVTITDSNKDGINFTATAGFTISGKVTIDDSGLGEVTMTLSGGVSLTTLTTTTTSLGEYSFSNLSSGTYTVTPSRAGYGFTPVSQMITISNANVENVDFSAAFGYSISGQVARNDSGLKGVTMTLSGDDSDTTTTDSEGNYLFTGLSDGSYTVTPTKQGFEFDPSSQDVTISGASETGVDFTAERTSAPTIFFIAPISGKSGQLLNIIGKKFGNEPGENGKVNIGSTTAKVKSWSNWKILVTVPKGSGVVKVSVTTDQGTSNEKNFIYYVIK